MTSKSIQLAGQANSEIDAPLSRHPSTFTAILQSIQDTFALLTRSELERSQAWHRTRRARAETMQSGRNIVDSLPVEEKLRLGLYHLID